MFCMKFVRKQNLVGAKSYTVDITINTLCPYIDIFMSLYDVGMFYWIPQGKLRCSHGQPQALSLLRV